MKILFRATVVAALATGLIALPVHAQDTVPVLAASPTNAVPPPATEKTNAPAARTKAPPKKVAAPAKPAAKKKETKAEPKPEPVLNPEPGVAKQNNVNVRGQTSINSEVIAHLQKNEPITVLEEITLKKPKQDEPARWYRIALPTNVSVWVHSSFIDPTTKAVKPRRLNLRGGPGENYSVVGRLEKGATVNQLDSKNGWLKIEPTTNAFGFVAAHLVERTPGGPAIVATPPPKTKDATTPTPPPVVAEVTPPTPAVVAGAPVTPPATTPPVTTPAAPAVVPAPAETLPDVPIEKVRKVVSREGMLKGSFSIQAPTYFELRSLDTGKTINYVFSPSTNLVLKEFKGKRIIVSGEELLDERWQQTPVIIVDSLQTVP